MKKKFKEANEAYDTLKDTSKKQEYDTMRRFGSRSRGKGSNFKFTTGGFDEFQEQNLFVRLKSLKVS